jgi:hypothetical protein
MKIDYITDTVVADERQQMIMDIFGYDALYLFIRNGKPYSVEWDEKSIETFLPRFTVSEFILNDIATSHHNFVRNHKAVSDGVHPIWTSNTIVDERRRKMEERPTQLSSGRHVRGSAMHMLKESYYNSINPLIFVKVVKEL